MEILAGLFWWSVLLGSIALTWWAFYFRHPPKPKQPRPFKMGRDPEEVGRRFRDSVILVLVLDMLFGHRDS